MSHSHPTFQPSIVDPDAVVALASAALKGSSSHQAAELRSTQLVSLDYGHHPHLNHRTLPLLDAVAKICVKEGGSNVAAVALKMRSPVIEIIVATNNETPKEDTIEYIRNVLHLLQNISDRRFVESSKNVDLGEKSPPVDLTEGALSLMSYLSASISTAMLRSKNDIRNIGQCLKSFVNSITSGPRQGRKIRVLSTTRKA